jgi:hypothetical protein
MRVGGTQVPFALARGLVLGPAQHPLKILGFAFTGEELLPRRQDACGRAAHDGNRRRGWRGEARFPRRLGLGQAALDLREQGRKPRPRRGDLGPVGGRGHQAGKGVPALL